MDGIVIVGYGRMGCEIEKQAGEMGIKVLGTADSSEELRQMECAAVLRPGVIAIEFSSGSAAAGNLEYLLGLDLPVVCGSTPWEDSTHNAVLDLRRQRQGYLMFSSNYSIGINVFWQVVRHTSRLLNNFTQYDLSIYEQHHNNKLDSPSGTAVTTANIVLQELERKNRLLYGNPQNPDGSDRAISPEELQLSSQRIGDVAGLHQLFCDSPEDHIVISHSAHNRAGFARGALAAAQFLAEQVKQNRPGFFSMDDLMNYFLERQSFGN